MRLGGSRLTPILGLALLGWLGSGARSAQAADVTPLAAELVRLRSEVDALSGELEVKKDAGKSELRELTARRAELDADVRREQLRLTELEQSMTDLQRRVREASAHEQVLAPVVKRSIARLRASITRGLPFQVDDRTDELSRLERQLDEGLLTPSQALPRLWARFEDELRLVRESGMYQQRITVEGREVLADVVRLGMVALYFRTPDARVGYAVRDGAGSWSFSVEHTPAGEEAIGALFDGMKKQIRVGYYELPHLLTPGALADGSPAAAKKATEDAR